MEKKHVVGGLIALIIIAAIVWVSSSHLGIFGPQTAAVGSGEPIKIAALLSLTGAAPAWGENAQKAIELATDEVNSSGGINGRQVEVIYQDTGADPKKAVSAFHQATAIEHAVAVIGPLQQTEDMAVAPLIEKTGTPTIIPGYIPLQNRSNLSNPILVWLDAQVEAERMAQYVYNQGIRRVAIVGTLDSWEMTVSNAFADKFKALGGSIAASEIVQPEASDMRLPITRIMASKPEAVFLGTYYQFVKSTKDLRDLGYSGQVFSIEVDDYLAEQTAGWVKELQFVGPDYYSAEFVEKFKAAYGRSPGLPAGQAYDAAKLLFSLLKQSTDQKELLAAMKDFKGYQGVSGNLQIEPDGRTTLPTALFELKDGIVSRVSSLQ